MEKLCIPDKVLFTEDVTECARTMSELDILQRIPRDDVPNLLTELRKDFPSSVVVHYFIQIQLDWAKKIPGMDVQILCPRGVWHDGTVVVLVDGLALQDKQYGVVYAREGHDEELAAALMSTRAVPWQRVLHFGGVLERHESALRRAAEAAGFTLPQQQPPLSALLLYPENIISENEKPLSLKPGERVGKIELRHLDEIWRLRPIFPDCYKPVIAACLEHNVSVGIFVTQADGSELLASMVVQSEYGGLGMGQTHENYLRRGFSALAGWHLISEIKKAGIKPFAWSSITNKSVENFMKKYGVPSVNLCRRLVISPDLLDTNYKSNL